jgi:uncharacterized protein YukE
MERRRDSDLSGTMASKEERLEQMNQLLDYIRANLRNIRRTWGEASPQYESAVGIMERALTENARRLELGEVELDELMGKMKLEER